MSPTAACCAFLNNQKRKELFVKPKKRLRSEREILAQIHACHRDANQCIVEAESLETIAKQYFTMPDMVEDARLKMQEASKLRARSERLIESKAKRLGEKLAEFQTVALPFLTDQTVSGL